MIRRKVQNFHETFEYQYAVLFGNKGLYLPMVVKLERLPDDIYCYYLQKDRRNGFYSFSIKNERKTVGIFFTKTAFQMKGNLQYIVKQDDFELGEKLRIPEEFFSFFKVKLSLDKQISLADERRKEEPEEDEDEDENHLFMGKEGQY